MARVALAERRAQLIDAAARVIATHGLEKTTTRAIADEAKSPLNALHYCFPSKEALLVAVYDKHIELVRGFIGPPPARIGLGAAAAALLRARIAWCRDNEAYAQASIELYIWASREDRELGRRAYNFFEPLLVEHLRAGLRPGEDKALLDQVMRIVTAVGDGLVLRWLSFRDWEQALADAELAAEAVETVFARRSGARSSG